MNTNIPAGSVIPLSIAAPSGIAPVYATPLQNFNLNTATPVFTSTVTPGSTVSLVPLGAVQNAAVARENVTAIASNNLTGPAPLAYFLPAASNLALTNPGGDIRQSSSNYAFATTANIPPPIQGQGSYITAVQPTYVTGATNVIPTFLPTSAQPQPNQMNVSTTKLVYGDGPINNLEQSTPLQKTAISKTVVTEQTTFMPVNTSTQKTYVLPPPPKPHQFDPLPPMKPLDINVPSIFPNNNLVIDTIIEDKALYPLRKLPQLDPIQGTESIRVPIPMKPAPVFRPDPPKITSQYNPQQENFCNFKNICLLLSGAALLGGLLWGLISLLGGAGKFGSKYYNTIPPKPVVITVTNTTANTLDGQNIVAFNSSVQKTGKIVEEVVPVINQYPSNSTTVYSAYNGQNWISGNPYSATLLKTTTTNTATPFTPAASLWYANGGKAEGSSTTTTYTFYGGLPKITENSTLIPGLVSSANATINTTDPFHIKILNGQSSSALTQNLQLPSITTDWMKPAAPFFVSQQATSKINLPPVLPATISSSYTPPGPSTITKVVSYKIVTDQYPNGIYVPASAIGNSGFWSKINSFYSNGNTKSLQVIIPESTFVTNVGQSALVLPQGSLTAGQTAIQIGAISAAAAAGSSSSGQSLSIATQDPSIQISGGETAPGAQTINRVVGYKIEGEGVPAQTVSLETLQQKKGLWDRIKGVFGSGNKQAVSVQVPASSVSLDLANIGTNEGESLGNV